MTPITSPDIALGGILLDAFVVASVLSIIFLPDSVVGLTVFSVVLFKIVLPVVGMSVVSALIEFVSALIELVSALIELVSVTGLFVVASIDFLLAIVCTLVVGNPGINLIEAAIPLLWSKSFSMRSDVSFLVSFLVR